MVYLNILSLLLLLLVACATDRSQNESAISLNRTRRLSNGIINEDTIRLAKYLVSIRTRAAYKYYGDNHFCGGVILSPLFILTSAHCLITSRRVVFSSQILLVVAGTPNRLRYQQGRSFHSPVKKIIIPDNFTIHNSQDIGLLFLMTALPRDSDYISIAKLPMRPLKVGSMCAVMSWGRMYRFGPVNSKILHINIDIIPSKTCAEMLGIKKNDLLCGTNRRLNSSHPCGGDRGAPLMHHDTIYGIVSFIVGCDSDQMPSVYTDVYKNLAWIRRAIMKNRGHVRHVSFLLVYGITLLNLRQGRSFIFDL